MKKARINIRDREWLRRKLTEKYIEENISRRITVKELAERLGVSETSLYLAVKKAFGSGRRLFYFD